MKHFVCYFRFGKSTGKKVARHCSLLRWRGEIMKVGDLVKHKNPKFAEHEGVHLVTFASPLAFQFLGHTGFHSPSDWEVVSEGR